MDKQIVHLYSEIVFINEMNKLYAYLSTWMNLKIISLKPQTSSRSKTQFV